jgi:hypothetical protein
MQSDPSHPATHNIPYRRLSIDTRLVAFLKSDCCFPVSGVFVFGMVLDYLGSGITLLANGPFDPLRKVNSTLWFAVRVLCFSVPTMFVRWT